MSHIKIANFAKTTLALGCTDTDLALNVADASVLPSITGEDYFFLVLENSGLDREIVKCTSKAANVLTVERAQENTTARSWNQGDRVALRLTAGTLEARLAELESALDTRLDAVESGLSTVAARIRIGEVTDWPTEVVPAGFLECDGSAVSRTTYADLYSAIGTRYGSGDGVTTFNLPDRRGEFVRGWDHGVGRDPDAATRTNRGDGTTGSAVGTKQADQYKEHVHPLDMGLQGIGEGGAWAFGDREAGQWGNPNPTPMNTTVCQSAGGNETRPRNVYTMYVIRYA